MNKNVTAVILIIVIVVAGYLVYRATKGRIEPPSERMEIEVTLVDIKTGEKVTVTQRKFEELKRQKQTDPDASLDSFTFVGFRAWRGSSAARVDSPG